MRRASQRRAALCEFVLRENPGDEAALELSKIISGATGVRDEQLSAKPWRLLRLGIMETRFQFLWICVKRVLRTSNSLP